MTAIERRTDPAARRLRLYRLAAECAARGFDAGFARDALVAERNDRPPGDPIRGLSDDDVEAIVRRTYATHRRLTEPGDPAVAS